MKQFFRSIGSSLIIFVHSIRFRITLWFVFMLAVALAAFSTFIYFTQARDLQGDAVGEMQGKLDRLQAYFRSSDWQNSSISPADVPASNGEARLQTGDLRTLTDLNGQIVQNWGATPSDSQELITQLVNAFTTQHAFSVYQRSVLVSEDNLTQHPQDYLLIIVPVLRQGIVLGFLVLGSPSPLPGQLHRLVLTLLLGSLGILVLAFLGGWLLADRAMRPVKTISRAAHEISDTDLSRRLNLTGRDELAQLAGTFDEMLSRLQAAFDRQRRFVADASHELRTPLTIINLEVGRVLTGKRTASDYQHALEIVDSEGIRMTRLVNDLMTLARMDSGHAPLQMEDLDLSDVTVEAVERMSPLSESRHVKLEMGEMPELRVRGDRQYLIQMVSNLVENGIKYAGTDQKVLIETSLVHNGKQDLASLSVSDTGHGIPAEHLPHLFDRFYRVDEARSRDLDTNADIDPNSPSGMGLGLSIVARIVELHHGQIHVDSLVNHGSTFKVTLPLA